MTVTALPADIVSHVGLVPDNTSVRQTLSAEFQAYLTSLDEWLKFLVNLRDALARVGVYDDSGLGSLTTFCSSNIP